MPRTFVFAAAGSDAADWLAAFQQAFPQDRVVRWPDPAAANATYALVWRPPQELWGAATRLKAIFNLGAGVDALITQNVPPHVPLIRLVDAGMGEQIADYVLWAVLTFQRGLQRAGRAQARAEWVSLPFIDKSGFPVAVLGLGAMGEAICKRLIGNGFPVHAWSRTPRTLGGVRTSAGPTSLPAVLRESRVLVNALPLTADTTGLLNAHTFSQLPRGAYVVNVGRGATINDHDLLTLLDSGHIAGAALDVFAVEPLPAEHPFWTHQNVVVTPHIAAPTLIGEAVRQIAANIEAIEAGKPPLGVVDRALGY